MLAPQTTNYAQNNKNTAFNSKQKLQTEDDFSAHEANLLSYLIYSALVVKFSVIRLISAPMPQSFLTMVS